MTFAYRPAPFLVRIAALGAAFLLAGCGERTQSPRAGGGSKGGGAAPVLVSTVHRKKVPLVIEAIGAVEPIRSASVRSQVTGILRRIAFREGQDVQAGDLLFEIDPRPFRNALAAAEADLQKLKVQLENARAQVTRYQSLNAGQMVSQEQFQKIQDDARALEAQVLSAEADVLTARIQLEHASIRAPVAGRTGRLGVHEGDLIRAGESGPPLVTINQLSPIYVTFGVPQQHLGAINRYRAERALPVTVLPPGHGERPLRGELTFIDNTVDAATGTIRLKATFANQEHRLWPGQFATATLTLAEPEVLTIAASAVQTSQTGQHVFVVSAERIAELRPVVVERLHEGQAVISRGLNEGETVIIDGQLRVIPGRPVEIKQPAAPTTPAAMKTGEAAAGTTTPTGKAKKQT